jgi:hypothetical protein
MLLAEADRVERHDATRAAALLANAAITCLMAGNFARASEIAYRSVEMIGRAAPAARMLLAHVRAMHGEVDETSALFAPLLESLQSIDPLGDLSFMFTGNATALVWIEQWVQAERMFDRFISTARTAGAPTVLPLPLAVFSDFELRRGKIAASYAAAAESVQLAAETGQMGLSSFSLATLARVEAVLGHDGECRAHVAAALELSRRTGSDVTEIYAASTLGLLELSRGHADRAAVYLTDCARLEKRGGIGILLPTVTQWAVDLVEAQIRSGAVTDAKRIVGQP